MGRAVSVDFVLRLSPMFVIPEGSFKKVNEVSVNWREINCYPEHINIFHSMLMFLFCDERWNNMHLIILHRHYHSVT